MFRRNPRDGFLQPAGPYRLLPDVLRPARPAPRIGQHSGTWRDRRGRGARPRPPHAEDDHRDHHHTTTTRRHWGHRDLLL